MIRRIGHVALRVPDLVAAVRHATEILGLREVERSGGTVYLTCDATHHGLQLIEAAELGFDHAGFEAAGPDGLERVREALARAGIEVIAASPQEEGLTEAVRFVAPGGLVFEVYDGIDHVDSHYNGPGVRPVKLQHITFRSSEMEQLERLFMALEFRLSDRLGDAITWLRCNPDHHGVALVPGPNGLHHYAWEVESFSDLERLGDRLLANGKRFMFGPGRHGPGLNLFCYHLDASGVLVEYSADLLRIYDDTGYEPLVWPDAPESINQWGPAPPGEFLEQVTPAAPLRAGVG